MTALRTLSERPELVVDDLGQVVGVPVFPPTSRVGVPGPFGRERLVAALPLNKSGHIVQLEPWRAVVDDHGVMIGAPDGSVVGNPPLFVHRYLTATRSPQTRR